MADDKDKSLVLLRFLTLLVFVSLFAQVFVSCFAYSRVNQVKSSYQVTEREFVSAVERSVNEFLSGFVQQRQEETNTITDVRQDYLEGGCIWSSPRRGYLLRVRGVDYAVGDYLGSGVIIGIHPGKVYVRSNEGITIFRPVQAEDVGARSVRADASFVHGEKDAPL